MVFVSTGNQREIAFINENEIDGACRLQPLYSLNEMNSQFRTCPSIYVNNTPSDELHTLQTHRSIRHVLSRPNREKERSLIPKTSIEQTTKQRKQTCIMKVGSYIRNVSRAFPQRFTVPDPIRLKRKKKSRHDILVQD